VHVGQWRSWGTGKKDTRVEIGIVLGNKKSLNPRTIKAKSSQGGLHVACKHRVLPMRPTPRMNPLKIKDIFLQSTDFRPAETVEPYPIPRAHDSPRLFTATFTFDEFRSFWATERIAFQWEFRSEGGRRDFAQQVGSTLLPTYVPREGRGKPRQFDWSFRFRCRRHRPPKDLAIRRESVGTGCLVYIRIRKPIRQDTVQVEYFWRHNHDVSAKARAMLPVGKNELNWTKSKIAEGLDWMGIKTQLQPSEDVLRQLELEQVDPPPSTNISYQHFRKAIYRQETSECRKAEEMVKSVRLWMEQIEQEGGKTLFMEQIEDSRPDSFIIAWSTPFQLEVLFTFPPIWYLDHPIMVF